MPVDPAFFELICCPDCRARLEIAGDHLRCVGAARHRFEMISELFPILANHIRPGKYGYHYAQLYAAVWAYGYETRNNGAVETLYRTISSLVAECLADQNATQPLIVDCGCGVGRVSGDCARLVPSGTVIAIDGSLQMLDVAHRIVSGDGRISFPIPSRVGEHPMSKRDNAEKERRFPEEYGFEGFQSVACRAAGNVWFAQADAENIPVHDERADISLCVNIVDRLPQGPEQAIRECFRILRPGGHFVFADPLNWTDSRWWAEYGKAEALLELIRKTGFQIHTWFDDLPYRELNDGRGFVHEFRAVAVAASKPDS